MGFLDIMSRIISILVGLATLAEKGKSYIGARHTQKKTHQLPPRLLMGRKVIA